ncbi:hypothetical protein E2C01_080364 [Portunus trituberculatus]|uniref:Uncharacterized protein n=1 Tax=Portunus trituberculatus TaxID=210409 RepID=A0A5B7IZE5_PORTR|nr:hypothetical protein [Portunus trituberculatus]
MEGCRLNSCCLALLKAEQRRHHTLSTARGAPPHSTLRHGQ